MIFEDSSCANSSSNTYGTEIDGDWTIWNESEG